MAYPYSSLPTPITDATTATPTNHASHHNSVHTALNDLLTELGSDPGGASSVTSRLTALEGAGSSLTGLHSGLLAVKVWSSGSSAYVWSGGTAPSTDGYTNIVFVDPTGTHNPTTSTGGRTVTNDLWETGTTPAGVPSGGTTGQVLSKTSSTDYATTWSTPSTGALGSIIAMTRYNPGTQTGVNTTSTTFADVDATNLQVTFTVPSTGNVLIELSALAYCAVGCALAWNLRESSSNLAGTGVLCTALDASSTAGGVHMTTKHYVSGLTPAASKTYKWGHARTTGSGNATTFYGQATDREAGAAFITVHSMP